MKSYYKLAWKEILGQKVVSVLILIAIVLSAAMTTAVGQAAGNLNAMRRQQAIAIRGNSYASFVQLTEEKAQVLEHDARLSYAGRYIQIGSMELNDILRLDLAEYWGDGLHTRPSYTKLVEGHLPEKPMEIALSEDALQFWDLPAVLETQFLYRFLRRCAMMLQSNHMTIKQILF